MPLLLVGGGIFVVALLIRGAVGNGLAEATAPDRIRPPEEVREQAERAQRRLRGLAIDDPAWEPGKLADTAKDVFRRVQQCWERRDYGPLRGLLTPAVRAKHEALLALMRGHQEVNRIDDLSVLRLELVDVRGPDGGDPTTFDALITFRAAVYFVHQSTGAYLRGSRTPATFQEVWTFRRGEDRWLLQEIEKSQDWTPPTPAALRVRA
jgi:predicted lipid-binding transport protein (Tim44 family)